jgi:hypothetical protein
LDIPFKPYWDLLAGYVRPERRRFALLSVLLLSKIGLQLAHPQIMRTFIDVATQSTPLGAEGGETSSVLFRSGLLYLLVAIVLQAVTVAVAYVGKDLGWRTTNTLRADLARHCLRLDMSFHNARTPGEMIERIDGDVDALSNFFSQFVVQVLGNVILLVGVLVLLFEADWHAGLAMALFSTITLAIIGRLQGFGSSLWEEQRQARADLFGFLRNAPFLWPAACRPSQVDPRGHDRRRDHGEHSGCPFQPRERDFPGHQRDPVPARRDHYRHGVPDPALHPNAGPSHSPGHPPGAGSAACGGQHHPGARAVCDPE